MNLDYEQEALQDPMQALDDIASSELTDEASNGLYFGELEKLANAVLKAHAIGPHSTHKAVGSWLDGLADRYAEHMIKNGDKA